MSKDRRRGRLSIDDAISVLCAQFVFAELIDAYNALDPSHAETVWAMLRHVYAAPIENADRTRHAIGRRDCRPGEQAVKIEFPDLGGATIVITCVGEDPEPWIVDFAVPGSARPKLTIYTMHGPNSGLPLPN